MDTEVIEQLAAKIASEAILENWKFYLLVLLLSSIGAYIANFLAGYARRRGENLATKADLDGLKGQLKIATEMTEQIKSDIEHKVWRKQQMEALRREKMEEYLTLIYVAQEDLSSEMYNKFFGAKEEIDAHAISKATMIRRLYFPELKIEHSTFLNACSKFKLWMAEGLKEIQTKKANGEQYPVISQDHMNKYTEHLSALNAANLLLEDRAEKIANDWNII